VLTCLISTLAVSEEIVIFLAKIGFKKMAILKNMIEMEGTFIRLYLLEVFVCEDIIIVVVWC
jgi:hypothetical protein